MDVMYILTLFAIGLVGSFISGMLGIGGAIVKYPLLLYVPPILGFAGFTSHQVSGISALDVLFVSIAGVLAFRNGGYLNKKLIAIMGTAILFGTLLGSFGSNQLSGNTINIVYGILALLAAIMMFIPKKQIDDIPLDEVKFNAPLSAILAFFVGIGSGIVGAGGGFLLIPIMLLILRIPTRMTIASSLAVTFISSIAGSFGKIMTGQIDYIPAMIVIIAGLIAAPLGARTSKKMDTKLLQRLLAILILLTAIKVWIDIL